MIRLLSSTTLALQLLLALVLPLPAQDRPAAKPAPQPGPQEVRQAVARALPFLEKEGLAWMKDRKCVACHHSAFMLWSHYEAQQHGIAVDQNQLAGWTQQSLDLFLTKQKEMKAKKNGGVESAHLLLGQVALLAGSGGQDPAKTLGEILANAQKEEGFWKYEGQELKRPDLENNHATTLWAVLALTVVEKSDPVFAKKRTQALAWLGKGGPLDSNEALVAKLLVEHRFGALKRANSLQAEQNPDGGWSWTKERPSDAFATGQVLYALARTGGQEAEPAVRRGWQYLLARQKPDGSWQSPTRKPKGGFNPIANYWGTAWATIGLARSLPVSAERGAAATPTLRVFYTGHSFHMFVPGRVTQMAKTAGVKEYQTAGAQGIGGSRVQQHWDLTAEKNQAKKALEKGDVDVFTMAPNVKMPDEGIDRFAELGLKHNPKMRFLIQESWVPGDYLDKRITSNAQREETDPTRLRSSQEKWRSQIEDHARAINKKAGRGVVSIVPVGDAVIKLRELIAAGKVPGITKQSELFTDTIGHGKAPILLLAAYCNYACITGRSPVGLAATEKGLSAELHTLLQRLAWETVAAYPLSGVQASK